MALRTDVYSVNVKQNQYGYNPNSSNGDFTYKVIIIVGFIFMKKLNNHVTISLLCTTVFMIIKICCYGDDINNVMQVDKPTKMSPDMCQ